MYLQRATLGRWLDYKTTTSLTMLEFELTIKIFSAGYYLKILIKQCVLVSFFVSMLSKIQLHSVNFIQTNMNEIQRMNATSLGGCSWNFSVR